MVGPILVSIVGAVVAAIVAGAAQAQPAAQARDSAAIKACLERQKATLGHACIGIVADPCTAAAGGDTAKRNGVRRPRARRLAGRARASFVID